VSAADRPWWASDDELDGDVDPLEAHRRARRGNDPDGAARDDGTWWTPAAEAVSRFAREIADGTAPDDAHRVDACGVCPICVGLRVLGDARPELVGHLAEAARQLALAVRTVVDAAGDSGDPARADGPAERRRGGLQHIDLDD
jgi:hypothetical protein